MTIHELQIALKAHDLHVYPDTGGIYTFMGKHFIGSVSGADRSKQPVRVAVVRLNKNHVVTLSEYAKAVQAVCAINGIQVIGAD